MTVNQQCPLRQPKTQMLWTLIDNVNDRQWDKGRVNNSDCPSFASNAGGYLACNCQSKVDIRAMTYEELVAAVCEKEKEKQEKKDSPDKSK